MEKPPGAHTSREDLDEPLSLLFSDHNNRLEDNPKSKQDLYIISDRRNSQFVQFYDLAHNNSERSSFTDLLEKFSDKRRPPLLLWARGTQPKGMTVALSRLNYWSRSSFFFSSPVVKNIMDQAPGMKYWDYIFLGKALIRAFENYPLNTRFSPGDFKKLVRQLRRLVATLDVRYQSNQQIDEKAFRGKFRDKLNEILKQMKPWMELLPDTTIVLIFDIPKEIDCRMWHEDWILRLIPELPLFSLECSLQVILSTRISVDYAFDSRPTYNIETWELSNSPPFIVEVIRTRLRNDGRYATLKEIIDHHPFLKEEPLRELITDTNIAERDCLESLDQLEELISGDPKNPNNLLDVLKKVYDFLSKIDSRMSVKK